MLFREQASRLWRSLVLATGDPDVADDAVAEAFAQALRREDEIRDAAAWVWKTAFVLAERESGRRRTLTQLRDDMQYETSEELLDVVRALSRLTDHQRTAVVLADYAGFSHGQIAQVLGSSVSAVGVHVYRARRRLRRLLVEDLDA
jgi:RNA polymerase sigma-70 factor (ECF subfamily)